MISRIAESALKTAIDECARREHAERSQNWVRCFAQSLQSHSQEAAPGSNVVAFFRSNEDNRTEFRMNELLFDILVAETTPVEAVRGKAIQAVVKALWVVESELKESDSRDILIDLNKLVLAKSENKVLVISADTPLVAWTKQMMAKLLLPAESNIYLVTIPHPRNWGGPNAPTAMAYQLGAGSSWSPPATLELPNP